MRSGKDYIEGLRDGRSVYIDGERVEDVTTHPAFSGAVRSIAKLYDIAKDPANKELMTYPSPKTGEPVNRVWMIPKSREDLALRRGAIKRWSEATFGLMGRSPDHVASFLAAFAAARDVFARGGERFATNVVNFYEKARDNDIYVSYTIVPPQIDRSKPAHQQEDPTLYAGVVGEREDGIILKGAQMLGTGSAISDMIFLSCIHPLRPGDENYAISVVLPVNAPGLRVHSRRSYAEAATSTFDYPLSSCYDETDSWIVLDDVFVPWEHVFIYKDIPTVRAQFFETAAHILGNNQAQIRFWTKLQFLVGLMKEIAEMNGLDNLPPVQGEIGYLATHAAMVEGLVLAQEAHCEIDKDGVARPGKAELYANMVFQSEIYPKMLNIVRELCGGGLLQLPSSVKDFDNPTIAADLGRYIQSPGTPSEARVKLMKLAWDLVGSEFASRQYQYEMFYAGAPFLIKGHMYRNYDFAEAKRLVADALSRYDLTGRKD